MLESIRRACDSIGLSVRESTVRVGSGIASALVIKNDGIEIFAVDRGRHFHLQYVLPFKEDETRAFTALPKRSWTLVRAALEGACSEGRTIGYLGIDRDRGPQAIEEIRLVQMLIFEEGDRGTLQRVVDGIVEMTVVARKVLRTLGDLDDPFDPARPGPPPTPHEAMYG